MALRSKWSVRIHRLETFLRVGTGDEEQYPQPVIASLRISGLAETQPANLGQCFDYQPICRWMVEEWPQMPHTELLETRFNELIEHIFSKDKRVMNVWLGLYKSRAVRNADLVGLERDVTRRQYQEQSRQPFTTITPFKSADKRKS